MRKGLSLEAKGERSGLAGGPWAFAIDRVGLLG